MLDPTGSNEQTLEVTKQLVHSDNETVGKEAWHIMPATS